MVQLANPFRRLGPLNWGAFVNVCGIGLGAFSALLVARGLLFRSPFDVFLEFQAFGGWDFTVTAEGSRVLQGWLSQRLDTRIGLLLLVLSFLCQGAAMLLPDTVPRHRSAVAAACLCVLLAVPAYFGITTWTDAQARSQALVLYERMRHEAPESSQSMIDERLRELRTGKQ